MRLNFSGVGEDDIREGVARIGKVVREQVALYSTLTGQAPASPASHPAAAEDEARPPATVHELSARRARER
jgi:2-aminoadipate transaminase